MSGEPKQRDIQWGTEVGEKLRRLRATAGITQDELVRRSGLSRATIQNYERGIGQEPPVEILAHLAVGLGAELDDLLPDDLMGRIALSILRQMDDERGKDVARLSAIAGRNQSNRRSKQVSSGASSSAAADSLLEALKPAKRRVRRSGGTSKTWLTQTRVEQPEPVLARAS